MASDIALDQLIAITPGICGGKPRIANRRITVQDIAIWHERLGLSADQIATDFGLTLAEVHAALAYYFDNRQEIEAEFLQDEQWADWLKANVPSKLREKLGA